MTKGIIYITTGKAYTEMAINSAVSVKSFHNDMPIHLFTDQENISSEYIDDVTLITEGHRRSKLDFLESTPFDLTLFLDADTQLINPLGDIFDWLKKYDLAMAHAMLRNAYATNQKYTEQIPDAFAQYNSGVILFRKTDLVAAFFREWKSKYASSSFRLDQVILKELCWQCNMTIGVLPPYYNIRDTKYIPFFQKLGKPVVVLHLDAYKKSFGIKSEKKRQRTFFGRIKYLVGSLIWIIKEPVSWKVKLSNHD